MSFPTEEKERKRRRPRDDTQDLASDRKRSKIRGKISTSADQQEHGIIATVNGYDAAQSDVTKLQIKKPTVSSPDSSTWIVSGTVGGRFLPVDPIFSADERHFVLATTRTLQVYNSQNSQLYRKIDLSNYGHVTCLTLGASSEVFVGTSRGKIVQVDWHTGKILASKKVCGCISSISHTRLDRGSSSSNIYLDVLVFLEQSESTSGACQQTVHRLTWQKEETQPKELLKIPSAARDVQSLDDGNIVLVAAEHQIFIGLSQKRTPYSPESVQFDWYTITTADKVVSLHAMLQDEASASGKARHNSVHRNYVPALDIAVGTAKGVIFVYEDIAQKLIDMEARSDKKQSITKGSLNPKSLHWHRTSVNAVKWSLDGNYLISGGNESVLIIWQLKTGKKQELPHLGAAVDCLAVSPSGISYAILLADNSLIILSTADLLPTAHVSGIQSLVCTGDQRSSDHQGPTDHLRRAYQDSSAAAIHPTQPSQVLLSVSRSRSRTEAADVARGKPFLQTFDISSSRGLKRQALTRNLTTDLEIGPEGHRLVEPEVVLLQLSHDGEWLATIEEWSPLDDGHKRKGIGISITMRTSRLEIFLKLWQWDKENENWVLQARIDSPHLLEDDFTPAKVFGLEAHPSRLEFVTVGSDGFVRVWEAKTRVRNGVVVKGVNDEGLATWTQKHTVELDGPVAGIEDNHARKSTPSMACVAYSQDGSVVVAAHAHTDLEECGIVRFIDTMTGHVVQSRSDMFCGGLAGVALLDRHLVILSDALIVWDLVDDVQEFGYSIADKAGDGQSALRKLVVDTESRTFAIAVPATSKRSAYRLAIFDPRSPAPVFLSSKLNNIMNLLSVPGLGQYVVINHRAEVYTISQRDAIMEPLIDDIAALGEAALGRGEDEVLEEVNGDVGVDDSASEGSLEIEKSEWSRTDLPASEDDEEGIEFNKVSRQSRAELFEQYSTAALPSRHEMFTSIWDLYVPKAKSTQPREDAMA